MSPFDTAHTTSYPTLTDVRLSCIVFEISRAVCRNSPILTQPTHLSPPLAVTPVEFRFRKLRVPGLWCGFVCVILCLAVLVEHRLVTDRQTQTDRHGHGAISYTALA